MSKVKTAMMSHSVYARTVTLDLILENSRCVGIILDISL